MGLAAVDTASALRGEAVFEPPVRELRLAGAEPTTQTSAIHVTESFRLPPGIVPVDDALRLDRSVIEQAVMRVEVGRQFASVYDSHTADQFINSFDVVPHGLGSGAVGYINGLLRDVFGADAYIGSISLDHEEDPRRPQLIVRVHYAFPPDGDVDQLVKLHNEFLRRYVLEVPAESRQSIALESVPSE